MLQQYGTAKVTKDSPNWIMVLKKKKFPSLSETCFWNKLYFQPAHIKYLKKIYQLKNENHKRKFLGCK